MKALVLGGTGFVGSHVVDQLLACDHRVRVFSRTGEIYRAPLSVVDYVQGELTDHGNMAGVVDGVDVVFHLISTTVPATSNLDPVFDVESNLVPTVRLLQAAQECGVRKIVFLSSGGTVYGAPESVPIPESHPLRPICSYGVVKVAVENYLHMFHELHGLEYVALRASNPYGERQGRSGVQGIIGTFLHKISRGEALEVWGDGSLIRDFIHVEDLARLCVAAGESDKVGVYNGGSGRGASVSEVLQLIEQAVGEKLPLKWMESRSFDVPKVILDIRKSTRDFSWSPEIDLATGIKDTWEAIRKAQGI